MTGFFKKMAHSQKGLALPMVLALLALGSLTVLSSLSYAFTSVKAAQVSTNGMKGLYAAESGVEYALWSISKGLPVPPQVPGNVNGMAVTMQYIYKGHYTLYLGELIEPGEHNTYLDLDGNIVWDAGYNAYKYTITVTWQSESGYSIIHLEQVGARIPKGYTYVGGSANLFPGNLAINSPSQTLDSTGAWMLNWNLGPPLPSVSEQSQVRTQTFLMTGTGSLGGDYTWVVANREDVGSVGSFTGELYEVTSTARHPQNSAISTTTVAEIIVDGPTMYILSWRILK